MDPPVFNRQLATREKRYCMKNIALKPHRWHKQIQLAAVTTTIFLTSSNVAHAADWRMVIASVDVVVMVDADTFRRDAQQLAFRATVFQPKPDADGSIGNLGDLTFDCAGRRMQSEQMMDIRSDGSTAPTLDEKAGFTAVAKGSAGDLFLGRMCNIKPNGNKMNGVVVTVPPALAAKSVFGLLKLGLNSDQASELATQKYWNEKSLVEWLDAAAVPKSKRSQVRGVLAAQTIQEPPPCPPIVPLPSAVATGKVGRYTHSAQELVAGLWLRADGTFRYGLTVGSLDETAQGRWTAKGNRVQLINEPRPVPPAVIAGPGKLEPAAPLSLALVSPTGGGVPGVDFAVEFDSGEPLESYTQRASWVLPASEKRQPRFVTFSWPSYGLRPARFAIDTQTANVLTFVFTPNDFGVVDLTGLVVDADKTSLTLHRDGATMRFSRGGE